MLAAGSFFFTIAFFYPFVYLQLDASKHGINQTITFYSLVIMNGASFAGRLSSGFLAHSLGVVHITLASCISCSALIFSMATIGNGNVTSVVTIAILYGYAAGVYVGLEGPIIAFLTPDISEFGARLGLTYTFCGVAGLIGPPIQGALLSSDFIWWKPAIFSGITGLIASGCFGAILFLVKEMKEHQTLV